MRHKRMDLHLGWEKHRESADLGDAKILAAATKTMFRHSASPIYTPGLGGLRGGNQRPEITSQLDLSVCSQLDSYAETISVGGCDAYFALRSRSLQVPTTMQLPTQQWVEEP